VGKNALLKAANIGQKQGIPSLFLSDVCCFQQRILAWVSIRRLRDAYLRLL